MNDDFDRARIESDTRFVLDRDYTAQSLRWGLDGIPTPIFDNLAAERFSRDSH